MASHPTPADPHADEIVADFCRLVGRGVEDEHIDVVQAALTIARTEYPNLDFRPYHKRIGELTQRVRVILGKRHPDSPEENILALNRVLYDEEGFRGNREDYYDARNSFLNDVLDRRLGIPITLALVYMEVARGVGFPLFGVGMPGHFLLKHYDVDGRQTLIDAFEAGRVLTAAECQQRLDQIYSGQMPMKADFLVAVTRRQMLTRILNNLKSIHLGARDFRRALAIVDLILAIYPRSPEDVKQRAMLRYSLGRSREALVDFEDYLKMSPEASDADEIRQAVMAIRRHRASLN